MAGETIDLETMMLRSQHCSLAFLREPVEVAEEDVPVEPEPTQSDEAVTEAYMEQYRYEHTVHEEVEKRRADQSQKIVEQCLPLSPEKGEVDEKRANPLNVKA